MTGSIRGWSRLYRTYYRVAAPWKSTSLISCRTQSDGFPLQYIICVIILTLQDGNGEALDDDEDGNDEDGLSDWNLRKCEIV